MARRNPLLLPETLLDPSFFLLLHAGASTISASREAQAYDDLNKKEADWGAHRAFERDCDLRCFIAHSQQPEQN
jgi:hypothetical protein